VNHFYESIEGWFNFREIYDAAIREAASPAIFVEVGSWHGRSAAYMAVEIANSGKQIGLYCVDSWHGSLQSPGTHSAGQNGATFTSFEQHLRLGGIWDLVRPIIQPSAVAATAFASESLDFVMIDGAHDYASTREDVRAWLPKLKVGGVIAGDDADWPGVLIAVHETLPLSELTIVNGGANWIYRKQRSKRGVWTFRSERVPGTDYFAYIPYRNRPDLLARAVRSIPELWPDLVIIDQSVDGLRFGEYPWLAEIAGVYRAATPLMSFTQMMNWAQAEARARGAMHLVFMHNDAECIGNVASRILEFARERPRAGVVFTCYDAFAIFNSAALRDIGPWDETFRWYFADNDYYHRMKLRGWECANFGGDKVLHHSSQTLHADTAIAAEVASQWQWHEKHYIHKWGGPTGSERYSLPYNGAAW